MTRLFTAGPSDSTNRSALNRINPAEGYSNAMKPDFQNALNPGFDGLGAAGEPAAAATWPAATRCRDRDRPPRMLE